MSKAIAGAAMIAADLAIGAVFFLNPALLIGIGPMAFNLLNGVVMSLFAGGVSMEAGAIASALTSQRGQNITTRVAAGLRQIIYGQQRLGGAILYQSTTGAGGSSGNYVYNFVIAIATHEIDACINLYLDGRQVFWRQDGNAANVGCGSVYKTVTAGTGGPLVPVLTCTCTIASGAVTGIAVSGTASGYANVKAARYRVRIWGGGGSGAAAYATNSGSGPSPVFTVHMTAGGSGYTSPPNAEVQGKFVFGGMAASDEQDPAQPGYGLGYGIGPSGEHYNFSGKVFCEARFGDQGVGDYMTSLSANDSVWPSTARIAGVAYLYVNVGYMPNLFPGVPEIKVTVNGKNSILDPRTGLTGFTANWALQVADVITDPVLGLGDPSVNTAQLIAAANVCDELVATASQGSEMRYAQHLHYDTSTGPGDALQMMMPSAAGRLGRVGGEWFIWPAYWQGPTVAMDVSDLIAAPSWAPYRSYKELFNRVSGTYTAPNYPYNVAGNLYDRNGWYYGTRDNVWPLAWQPTNFPEFAADPLHGYSSDQFLAQDGGVPLPKEMTLRGVISIVQAQRVAKIALLRNRFQGSGTMTMGAAAWAIQPTDVVSFTWSIFGWASKLLEVEAAHFRCEPLSGQGAEEENSALAIWVELAVIETDPSIYEWSSTEELGIYDVPGNPAQIPSVPAAPTSVTVTSSAATAVVGADGIVTPRAEIQWAAPQDISVTMIEIQYRAHSSTAWIEEGAVDVGLFAAFVAGVVAGQSYDFRIRSVRSAGIWSVWVEVDNATISMTLSNTTGTGYSVAPAGTLTAQALADGTAQITVASFTAVWGGQSVGCIPSPNQLTALNQSQLYYVYYVDPSFVGGTITPVATGLSTDFANKVGYFLIGSISTPSYTPRYEPSVYHDVGTSASQNPQGVYDNNVATDAIVQATLWGTYQSSLGNWLYSTANGDCIWSGFPVFTTTGSMTLHVIAEAAVSGSGSPSCTLTLAATVGGATTTLATLTATTAKNDYALTVPASTNLNGISVEASAVLFAPSPGPGNLNQSARWLVYEIYVE